MRRVIAMVVLVVRSLRRKCASWLGIDPTRGFDCRSPSCRLLHMFVETFLLFLKSFTDDAC